MLEWLAHHRNWVINIIGVVAFVVWILIEYCLIKWGEILVSLCQAYVASWLFYLVVVYIKERHDKINVRPYIKRKVADLLYFHHKIVCKLAKEAGEDLEEKFPSNCRLEKYIQAISNENKAVKCFLRKKIGCIIEWPTSSIKSSLFLTVSSFAFSQISRTAISLTEMFLTQTRYLSTRSMWSNFVNMRRKNWVSHTVKL